MEQKTEAPQAVDELVADFTKALQLADKVGRSRQDNGYALNSKAVDALVTLQMSIEDRIRAALKAQPAPTEAAQGAQPSGNTGALAQGEDSALLAQDCIESIASGHGYMDSYESFHCACCGADLDEKEDHSDECLTIRAQKFLARASAQTGGVR